MIADVGKYRTQVQATKKLESLLPQGSTIYGIARYAEGGGRHALKFTWL